MPNKQDEQVAARAGPYVAGPTPDEARAKHKVPVKHGGSLNLNDKAQPRPEPQTEAVSPDE